jgi:hypothetical protein
MVPVKLKKLKNTIDLPLKLAGVVNPLVCWKM